MLNPYRGPNIVGDSFKNLKLRKKSLIFWVSLGAGFASNFLLSAN